jgi:hypothetical protein
VKLSATHSERERFVAILVKHAPAADSWHCQRLMRFSGTYHRLTVKMNRTFSEERKLERVKASIQNLCFDIRCTVVFNSHTFSLTLPDDYQVGVPGI